MVSLVSVIDPNKPVYSGNELMIVPQYLRPEGCAALIAYADLVGGKPAPVGDPRDDRKVGNRQDAAFTADRIDFADDTDTALKRQ